VLWCQTGDVSKFVRSYQKCGQAKDELSLLCDCSSLRKILATAATEAPALSTVEVLLWTLIAQALRVEHDEHLLYPALRLQCMNVPGLLEKMDKGLSNGFAHLSQLLQRTILSQARYTTIILSGSQDLDTGHLKELSDAFGIIFAEHSIASIVRIRALLVTPSMPDAPPLMTRVPVVDHDTERQGK
jgi:hypothetical protein